MTRITELLQDKSRQDFDDMVYEDGGLMERFPAWLTLSDEAIECIAVLVILEQKYDLDHIRKDKLYDMYVVALDFIADEYGETGFLCGSCFTKKSFYRFINACFPGWKGMKKSLPNHRS